MIWLLGIAVVLLATIAVICIQTNNHLNDIARTLNALSLLPHIADDQRNLARAALETLKEIARHTATSAAPEYDRQYERDHYPWGRPKDE